MTAISLDQLLDRFNRIKPKMLMVKRKKKRKRIDNIGEKMWIAFQAIALA
jgi:hypothetical protein